MIDWTPFVPPYDTQYCATTHTDAEDCVSESLCHIVFMMTGRRYSPPALAVLSHTTHSGNDFATVLNTANTIGLIPYEYWPTPSSFDWNSYNAPIPQSVLDHAEKLDIELISPDLNKSPLWTVLIWGANLPQPTRHAVAQINDTQYFDSETGNPIKPLTYEGASIDYQTSIKINTLPHMNIKTVSFLDGKTFGVMIDTPNGTQIIKATDENQWKSWNLPTSYNLPTVNPDGTTNWTTDYQLPF